MVQERGVQMMVSGEMGTIQLDGKGRIILTAEGLFAKGGIDGVSLRQIAGKAGQGNHHAVQYHFGSREGLVQAIFDFRMQQMEPMRGEMLATAEKRGALKDAKTLIEIILLPQLKLVDANGNHSYANFLCQYLLKQYRTEFVEFGSEECPHLNRALNLLRRRLDYLPARVAERRLITACFMFLNILSAHTDERSFVASDESFENALDDTLEQIVLATFMPLRTR